MNNFQSVLAFSLFITIIFMMFPTRAILASKPIVAILNALSKIADVMTKNTKK